MDKESMRVQIKYFLKALPCPETWNLDAISERLTQTLKETEARIEALNN